MSSSPIVENQKLGALGLAAVALGCAGLAAVMVGKLLKDKGYANERLRPVVVAKQDLRAAEALSKDALEVVSWPASSVPTGAVSEIAALFPEGKDPPVPTTGILKGEPVVQTRLAGAEQGTGLAALVRPGHRAVAVTVDDAVGRAKLVYPGAHVDVLATIRDPEMRMPSTRIAVENARVLAVEAVTDVATKPRKSGKDGDSHKRDLRDTVVTVEVTPSDAEILSLAAREGEVDLALRNGGDAAPAATSGAIPSQFSAFMEPLVPAPAAEDATPTQVRKEPLAARGRVGAARRQRSTAGGPDVQRSQTPVNGRIETYRAR